jgi:hypothetical protein
VLSARRHRELEILVVASGPVEVADQNYQMIQTSHHVAPPSY